MNSSARCIYRVCPEDGVVVPAPAPPPIVPARSSCRHLSLSAPIRFWHWLMPPIARGPVGATALGDGDGLAEGDSEGAIEGDCEGVTEGGCEGVAAGASEGVTAGVSDGVTLGGVRPDCGCAKAALASASKAAEAIDFTIIGRSFKAKGVPSLLQSLCRRAARAVAATS